MEDSSQPEKWSVVMTGWPSRKGERKTDGMAELGEALQEAFGREDMSMLSLSCCLTIFADEHLPTELVCGFALDQAEASASRLREAGAEIEVVPTESVSGMKHRADEVWSDRCAGLFCFTEIDGMIFTSGGLGLRSELSGLRRRNPGMSNWRLESAVNHFHPGEGSTDRERIESELLAIEAHRSALMEAYPDREFTISHWVGGHASSFWQTTPDSPHEEYPRVEAENPDPEEWCRNCGGKRRFRPIGTIDPRFAKAEWGACEVCGSEIVTRSCEKLTFIGPGADCRLQSRRRMTGL